MMGILRKRANKHQHGDRDTGRTRVKTKAEIGARLPQAKECQSLSAHHHELGERPGTGASLQFPESSNIANTLILDF